MVTANYLSENQVLLGCVQCVFCFCSVCCSFFSRNSAKISVDRYVPSYIGLWSDISPNILRDLDSLNTLIVQGLWALCDSADEGSSGSTTARPRSQ